MLLTIREFGLGESFSSWVEMLSAHPTASVLTNSDRSHPFNLFRSVRQGWPLSPLLFALCIEPFALSIRCNAKIIPISLGKMDHYIALYADDVLLFLSQPEKCIPPLLDCSVWHLTEVHKGIRFVCSVCPDRRWRMVNMYIWRNIP